MQSFLRASRFVLGSACAVLSACGARTGLSTSIYALGDEDSIEAGGPDVVIDAGVEAGPPDVVIDSGMKVTIVRMFRVPGTADLYRSSDPQTGDTPAVMTSDPPVCSGTEVHVTAGGCVISQGPVCVGADGNNGGDFKGLPVYSLIGQWGTSPNGLTAANAASKPFFVGSDAVVTAPIGPGRYFLYLAENDGIFADNAMAYSVTVTYTEAPTCL